MYNLEHDEYADHHIDDSDLTINTSDLPKGIYILEVYAEGRSSIKMIVK